MHYDNAILFYMNILNYYLFLLQVTGFGLKGEGDTGDDWQVVCEGAGYFSG